MCRKHCLGFFKGGSHVHVVDRGHKNNRVIHLFRFVMKKIVTQKMSMHRSV